MEILNKLLALAGAHPELTALLLGAGVELLSRKIPGSITFLHALSKILDKIPGLENKK